LLLANRTGDATALTDWEPLLCKPNLQFVNLMWGDGEAEIQKAENKFGIKILRWNDLDLKNDFESILALMQNLDAVVSVSSTPYALSSFSGIKTFLLTPNLWQLLGQKETHPWNKFITPIVIENNKHLLSKLNMLEAMLEAL
jgi:ADP-heptose:LPS heptosyltransferase